MIKKFAHEKDEEGTKEIKHESEIKDVLGHQLTNLRTYNLDHRAPAQDMAGYGRIEAHLWL